MITHEILAPHERGRNQNQNINDYKTGTWRVYFYDSNKTKEVYINRKGLNSIKGINKNDIEMVRNYLEKWAVKYLKNKKFEDIKNKFEIKL